MHSLLGRVLRPLQFELLRDADVRVQDPPSPHASHTEESKHSSNKVMSLRHTLLVWHCNHIYN